MNDMRLYRNTTAEQNGYQTQNQYLIELHIKYITHQKQDAVHYLGSKRIRNQSQVIRNIMEYNGHKIHHDN